MKHLLITIALSAAAATASAQTYEIPLWPNGPAEDNGITAPEERRDNWDVYNISEAVLYVWPADADRNTGRAVMICPGGSYAAQAAGHEGRQFAEWLAANGITAAVLKYRLPNGHSDIPLTDAMQAMKELRDMAPDWGYDANKIGVMGFSAGGHLASTLLTHYDEGSRPDFGILVYPVVSMGELTHRDSRRNLLGQDPTAETVRYYSSELQVTADTPPTMIFFSEDDNGVNPHNGALFLAALAEKGVDGKLELFPTGGHGWGFNPGFAYHEQMKALTLNWIGKF